MGMRPVLIDDDAARQLEPFVNETDYCDSVDRAVTEACYFYAEALLLHHAMAPMDE